MTQEPERVKAGPLGVLVVDYEDEPRLDIWAKASRSFRTVTLYQGGDVVVFPADKAEALAEALRAMATEAMR